MYVLFQVSDYGTEISVTNIQCSRKLGGGHFGEVWVGTVNIHGRIVTAAIKMLNGKYYIFEQIVKLM